MTSQFAGEQHAPSVLDRSIVAARAGALPPAAPLWVLAASDVLFLSQDEPVGNELPRSPLVLGHDGHEFFAIFSSRDRFGDFNSHGRVSVRINGFELIRRIPGGTGLVVNPGAPVGFEVPAEGLSTFLSDIDQYAVAR